MLVRSRNPAAHRGRASLCRYGPATRYLVNKLFLVILAATAIGFVSAPARSYAQEDAVRAHLSSAFGFGGEQSAEAKNDDTPDLRDADLIPTLGFALGVEVPRHTYFTFGAELGLSWWNTEERADPPIVDEYDRHRQLDMLLRPKLRFSPLSGLELYGVVPLGFTYCIPSKDTDRSAAGIDVEAKGGPGFAIGASAGATLFVLEHVGFTLEAGYLFRWFRAGLENDLTGQEYEWAMRFGQAQLRAGLTVAF
jgi:hypothetical protein